jgi:DNA helicase-2/ATP-dependent DNA helicase PcrA
MITTPNRWHRTTRVAPAEAPAEAAAPSVHSARFVASPEQQAYFDWIQHDTGSAVLESVAGSGKSTTAIEGLRYMTGSIFLGAYNKSAALDLEAKAEHRGVLRWGMFISTMHAAGFNTIRRAYPAVKVLDRKTADIIDRLAEEDTAFLPALEYRTFIAKMVSFGKQFLAGVKFRTDDIGAWRDLVEHFGVDSDLPDDTPGTDHVGDALEYTIRVFKAAGAACREVIDFDDMIYMPIAYNLRMFRNDWVIVDEAQDTNLARQELAKRMLKSGGRLVAIGDSRQAIYSFQGADTESLNRIATEHNCKRLSLTVSYRCPRAVVKYAQKWVSHIQAHPSAPEGIVRQVAYTASAEPLQRPTRPWFIQDEPEEDDAILCRYNKPLVDTAFAMLREGIACRIEGRDIGANMIQLAQRWKVKTLDALCNRLEKYREREIAKARKAKSERREQDTNDRVDTLLVFINRCISRGETHLACVIEEINKLFGDNVKGVVTLCSGHRSKGREWRRVWWLQATVNNIAKMQPWERVAEDNINYVLATRAMNELVLVDEAIYSAAPGKGAK